jgi:hypothetical protein
VREVGMYVVGIAVSLWLGSERVRVWLERIVERVFVSGIGRLRVSIAQKPMRKIGRAMSRRNSAAVIVSAMALAVVVAKMGNPTKVQKDTRLLWISSMQSQRHGLILQRLRMLSFIEEQIASF